jgi:hypothetical protein
MPSPPAKHYWKLTSLLCVLATLAACGTPQVVYRDREVKVPIPTRVPLDPRLTGDCPPATELPADGPLPVADALRRAEAVEDALRQCRGQLSEIRSLQEAQ